MKTLITSEQTLNILRATVRNYGKESLPLKLSTGRILKKDLHSDRDLPPFDRVTMDGIAVRYDALRTSMALPIATVAAAGKPQVYLSNPNQCVEVMTGAILPKGTDTVIRYEDLQIMDGVAYIKVDKESVLQGQNIHFRGSDQSSGHLLIASNTKISGAELAVAASIGCATITVARLPKIAIVSTGDELVDIDERPAPHQIRRSNVYALHALLYQTWKIDAQLRHLQDNMEQLAVELPRLIDTYDVVIFSGGISKGKFDYLPNALLKHGVDIHFHGVKQRPGKPFLMGSLEEKILFGLPGNPVSSFLCCLKYVHYWLSICLQNKEPMTQHARLTKDITFKPDLALHQEVNIHHDEHGITYATPVEGRGSGNFLKTSRSDAFIELPCDKTHFLAGECYRIYPYR